MSALASEEAWMVPWHADTTLRFEIYSHLDDNLQVEIIGGLNRQEIARLMSDMSHCDRADLFKLLP
jgi:magnesium transporter